MYQNAWKVLDFGVALAKIMAGDAQSLQIKIKKLVREQKKNKMERKRMK